jgi:predicted Zn finger-like uncharacterized protein
MRIACQNCSATYAIDDVLVAGSGVRAQCPRCRHLQLVKRPQDEAGGRPSSPSSLGAPPPMASPFLADAPPTFPDAGAPPPASGPGFGSGPRDARFDGAAIDAFSADASAEPQAALGTACQTCGKALVDPFDLALGVCDECRLQAQGGPGQGLDAADEPAGTPLPARPAPDAARPTVASTALLSAARPEAPAASRRRPVAAAAVGGLVLVAAGVGLAIVRPWAPPPPPLIVKSTDAPAKPAADLVQSWRLNFPELEGEPASAAKAFVEAGEALLARDTPSSNLDAEEEFQKALVLDPSNERALSGWGLALAFGRGAQLDAVTAEAVEAMLAAAEQRSAGPTVFLSHAHFRLARGGNSNDVKVLAERGKASARPADKALAELALAQTLLTRNPLAAQAGLKAALELAPGLKRTYVVQAQLAAGQGRYREAIGHLDRRLALDADQWEVAEALARLYAEVSEVARARAVLEAAVAGAPGAVRPRIALAILRYQHLGDGPGAEALLAPIADDEEASRGERARALVHLAVLARRAGSQDRAADLSTRAVELAPDSVAAHLQRLLVLLEAGDVAPARAELGVLKGRLQDKYLEATLEGRVFFGEGRFDDAVRVLSGVQEADARRADALLLAAAAAAKGGKDAKAWELCLKRGLKLEPRSEPVPPLTDLLVRPADLLAPARGAFLALSPQKAEDPNALTCEALVDWYSGDALAADKRFAAVTNLDGLSAHGYAYRALAALERKDLVGAERLIARGLDASRTTALALYANALALLEANKAVPARGQAAEALKLAPGLLGARVLMADVDARSGDREDARRSLTAVLLSDPLYREAKRVLYKHEL